MNIKNLYVVCMSSDKREKFKIEKFRKNQETGHNDVLITAGDQKIWLDTHEVTLYRDQGSVFCWKDHGKGVYIELNETDLVCPECGWWKCSNCGSCYCNKS